MLTITDGYMTCDKGTTVACLVEEGWVVSDRPHAVVTREQAIAAVALAEVASWRDDYGDPVRPVNKGVAMQHRRDQHARDRLVTRLVILVAVLGVIVLALTAVQALNAL